MLYCGRSSRLKQVWATGRYESPPAVFWMVIYRPNSQPLTRQLELTDNNTKFYSPWLLSCRGLESDRTQLERARISSFGRESCRGTLPKITGWYDDRPCSRFCNPPFAATRTSRSSRFLKAEHFIVQARRKLVALTTHYLRRDPSARATEINGGRGPRTLYGSPGWRRRNVSPPTCWARNPHKDRHILA